MTKPYKLLISGELVQQTAFSTGGSETESTLDMPLARNGKGEITLRGQSLAGAFIATAKRLFPKLSQAICEGTPGEQTEREEDVKNKDKLPRHHESLWLFHHAHPMDSPTSELRDHVAISQKTGAARHTAKFDTEILPAGTRWRFLMEVDQYRDKNNTYADSIALHVARQWEKCCWLGRDVARGLGWMKLENLKVIPLNTGEVSKWPDARQTPWDALSQFESNNANTDTIETYLNKVEPKPLHTLSGTLRVTIEPKDGGYGLDMLSVGGNNSASKDEAKRKERAGFPLLGGKAFIEENWNKLLTPKGQPPDRYTDFPQSRSESPDFDLAVSRVNGTLQPIIPGSALRGPLRHALSWVFRRQGADIWEPGEALPTNVDPVQQLLGSTAKSARLLIGDALLSNEDWKLVVLEMHAEDEFTGGVYGSGKYDRTALIQGEFSAPLHLDADSPEELERLCQTLKRLHPLLERQFLNLGGAQWKGLGWVNMTIQWNQPPEACHD